MWHGEHQGGSAYAEKSAEAVAAKDASVERRACQHAPLWPIKVPILSKVSGLIFVLWTKEAYQSPVTPSRSIGLLSEHFEWTVQNAVSRRFAYLCRQL